MAGRSPAESLQSYRDLLQGAISCVSDAVLLGRPDPGPGAAHSLVLSQRPSPVRGGQIGWLDVRLRCRIVQADPPGGEWEARTAAYTYVARSAAQREVFAYHWHPEGRSSVTFAHLHVSRPSSRLRTGASDLSVPVSSAHFPTGLVALQQVLRLLITDFGVRPRRRDWTRILSA